jgi:serine/threonine protein kinase
MDLLTKKNTCYLSNFTHNKGLFLRVGVFMMTFPSVSRCSIEQLYTVSQVFSDDTICQPVYDLISSVGVRQVIADALPPEMGQDFLTARRFQQIRALGNVGLLEKEVWNLAEVLDHVFLSLCNKKDVCFFFRKLVNKSSCSFEFDSKTKCFYIWLKKKSSFQSGGTYKKGRYSITVPFERNIRATLTWQKTNRAFLYTTGEINAEQSSEMFDLFVNEVKLAKECACCPQMLNAMVYYRKPFMVGGTVKAFKKLSVIEELYQPVSMITSLPSDRDFFYLTMSLLDGLLEFYKNERIHGDVKIENALWRGGDRARWTDLGFSRSFKEMTGEKIILEKYYGSITCTPPELLDGPLCTKEDVLAAEAWAFGYFLFSVFVGNGLPWGNRLHEVLSKDTPILPSDKKEIVGQMRGYLSTMRQIAEAAPITLPNEIKKISLRLLIIERPNRYTIEQAKHHLTESGRRLLV